MILEGFSNLSNSVKRRLSYVEAFRSLPSFYQWKREWLHLTPVWETTPEQRIRTGKVLVNLEQGAVKGEMTGVVKHLQNCCEGAESVLHAQRVKGRRKRALAECLRFSLEVKEHFP